MIEGWQRPSRGGATKKRTASSESSDGRRNPHSPAQFFHLRSEFTLHWGRCPQSLPLQAQPFARLSHGEQRELCNTQQLQISFPWKLEEPLEVCTELCSQAWAPRSLGTQSRGASWATRQAHRGRDASLLSGESSFTRLRIGRMLFQILLRLLKVQRGWFAF